MAGDWIPMRLDLRRDPTVMRLLPIVSAWHRDKCGTDVPSMSVALSLIVGALHQLWSAADEQSEDGDLPGYTRTVVDELAGLPGFAAALIAEEWLEETPNGLRIPDFGSWMGQSAKRRLKETRRKQRQRAGPERDRCPHEGGTTVPDPSGPKGGLQDRRETGQKRERDARGRARGSAPSADAEPPREALSLGGSPSVTQESARAALAALPELAAVLGVPEAFDRWLEVLDAKGKLWPTRMGLEADLAVLDGARSFALATIERSTGRAWRDPKFALDELRRELGDAAQTPPTISPPADVAARRRDDELFAKLDSYLRGVPGAELSSEIEGLARDAWGDDWLERHRAARTRPREIRVMHGQLAAQLAKRAGGAAVHV